MKRTAHLSDTALRARINEHFKAHKAARESISFLVKQLRLHEISFPTDHSVAEDEFKRLGFKTQKETNSYGSVLRTYVLAC